MTETIDASDIKKDHIIRKIVLMRKQLADIKRIANKAHEERYDTDWDSLQSALNKIYKLVNK